jgi:hypothetical protein
MPHLTKKPLKQVLKDCGRVSFFMADPIIFLPFFVRLVHQDRELEKSAKRSSTLHLLIRTRRWRRFSYEISDFQYHVHQIRALRENTRSCPDK